MIELVNILNDTMDAFSRRVTYSRLGEDDKPLLVFSNRPLVLQDFDGNVDQIEATVRVLASQLSMIGRFPPRKSDRIVAEGAAWAVEAFKINFIGESPALVVLSCVGGMAREQD